MHFKVLEMVNELQLLVGSFCSLCKKAYINLQMSTVRGSALNAAHVPGAGGPSTLDTRASVGAGATGQSPGWPARYRDRERSTALWEPRQTLALCYLERPTEAFLMALEVFLP